SLQPHREPERAARAGSADQADGTAHHLGQPFRNHQTQTRPAVTSSRRGIRLPERLEELDLLLWRDADAGVADLEAEDNAGFRLALDADGHHHLTLFGEFNCIADQIEQNL